MRVAQAYGRGRSVGLAPLQCRPLRAGYGDDRRRRPDRRNAVTEDLADRTVALMRMTGRRTAVMTGISDGLETDFAQPGARISRSGKAARHRRQGLNGQRQREKENPEP